MYHIHQTKGFVLQETPFGEADKTFQILTEEFGLVYASARGVRELKSKLRYNLQNFSYGSFSLVRGKDSWRVTGCFLEENIFGNFRDQQEILGVWSRAFSLLRRLLTGEDENRQLFGHLESAFFFTKDNRIESKFLSNFEYILVLKILHCLGYLGNSPDWSFFTALTPFDFNLLIKMDEVRKSAVAAINYSLKKTHL